MTRHGQRRSEAVRGDKQPEPEAAPAAETAAAAPPAEAPAAPAPVPWPWRVAVFAWLASFAVLFLYELLTMLFRLLR